MNKDVIYIEPEDDITDIITKIENAKEKIVALVPPKKAGVFRSIVNIKLIAKAGKTAEKSIVIVTTDPSIMKLAAATKLPVTKNLQTAPSVPTLDEEEIEETTSKEEVVEEDGEVKTTDEKTAEDKSSDDKDDKDDQDDKPNKLNKVKDRGKKAAKDVKKFSKEWFMAHKKLAIGGGVGVLVLILVLVWAFEIAPAATITVNIRTAKSNFSKSITFTDKLTDENVETGKFYLEEKKTENKTSVEFEATGKKNIGEKAKGDVVVYTYFSTKGTVVIDAGATFKIGDLVYLADEKTSLTWDGNVTQSGNNCENENIISDGKVQCLISGRVKVTASEAGESYNIVASSAGWSTNANVSVYSDHDMSGGTDDLITVVQQSDIDKAKTQLIEAKDGDETKSALLETIGENSFPIDSSFKRTVGEATSSPAVGEEVKNGQKAKLTVVVTDSIFIIDKTKVEEFIAKEANLAENYKIYSMNDPFVENFIKTDDGYTGKLKTSYISGPKVTENDVVEIAKGKGLGVAQHDLKDIDGVSSITIDPSFPWVTSIPNDPNKITVNLVVED